MRKVSLWNGRPGRNQLTPAEREAIAKAIESISVEEFQRRWAEAEAELEERLRPFRARVTMQTLLLEVD